MKINRYNLRPGLPNYGTRPGRAVRTDPDPDPDFDPVGPKASRKTSVLSRPKVKARKQYSLCYFCAMNGLTVLKFDMYLHIFRPDS